MEDASSVHHRALKLAKVEPTQGTCHKNSSFAQKNCFKTTNFMELVVFGDMLGAFLNPFNLPKQMEICPGTLAGKHVRLEPLKPAHEESLIEAAGDGELWNSSVTIVPDRKSMAAYIQEALQSQSQGVALPFVIIRKALNKVVGTTRFYEIKQTDRGVNIGFTWLAASAQRTEVNTEAKLLMLSHAFENWHCIRVAFLTDVLNEQSRKALLRLGAREEAILRNHMIMPNGRIRDSVCFSIIAEEWPDVKARLISRLSI
jgi:N-acetyltransferase